MIWCAGTARLHPCATSFDPYHSRSSALSILSRSSMTWPQGNWPTDRWPIASWSGQASANRRMYLRLAGENPFVWRNSARRSTDSCERTLLPHGADFCRPMIVAPICQYSRSNSVFTRRWAVVPGFPRLTPARPRPRPRDQCQVLRGRSEVSVRPLLARSEWRLLHARGYAWPGEDEPSALIAGQRSCHDRACFAQLAIRLAGVSLHSGYNVP